VDLLGFCLMSFIRMVVHFFFLCLRNQRKKRNEPKKKENARHCRYFAASIAKLLPVLGGHRQDYNAFAGRICLDGINNDSMLEAPLYAD
jgi:hypothetical protein